MPKTAKNKGKTIIERRDWTKEDVKTLKASYKKMTYAEIAKLLKRSQHGVERKAQRMGLVK